MIEVGPIPSDRFTSTSRQKKATDVLMDFLTSDPEFRSISVKTMAAGVIAYKAKSLK